MSDRSGPSTAMFHRSTEVDIEDSKLTHSGRDTTYNVQNNNSYIIGVVPDPVSYIKTAVQYFVPWTNQSIGVDSGDSLPQATATDHNLESSISDPVEISDIVPSDPPLLPVSSIADRYTRSMLECLAGYQLYNPKPFSELSKEYSRKGVNVGDVGFVRKDGAFDFLFNICPPHNDSINPPNLPDGFSLETPDYSATRDLKPLPHNTSFFSQNVTKTDRGEYICRRSDGAVLVLPAGAIQDEAINTGWFEDLARCHGLEWYKHTMARGRSISNGSLYLVTSYTKCTQWGMAVFDRPCDSGQALRLVSSPLGWNGSGALISMVDNADIPNQCVFLQGYKIMIREDIFNNLPKRQRATRIRGGGGTGLTSQIKKVLTGESSLARTTMSNVAKSDEVVLHANFNSSPIHPSDLINVALLGQNPEAKIALTHDDVWCDLLRDNFPTLNYVKLRNIARSYTSTIDKHGMYRCCVSLKKTSYPCNNSRPYRESETSGLQEFIQVRGEHNPDVFIPAQISSTLRLRSIDNFPGDRAEGNPSIYVPQVPPITQEPHKPGHSDTRSWEVRDLKYSISIAPPALDHSVEKGKGKRLEPAIASTETSGYRTQVLVGNASQSQLHHKAVLAKAANAHDVMQSNAFFQNAQIYISGNPNVQNNVTNVYGRGIDGLKYLDGFISFDTQFDSSAQDPTRQCHPGTRQNVLKRMRDWIDNPDSTERIFWLYGPAGAGKSAIAQTIAHSYARSTVAATFFFFRSDPNRNDGNRLFTTLAYQLARSIPGIRDHIARSLYERPDLPRADVETQFKQLIARPFRALNKDVTRQKFAPVIIIDGVDECTDQYLQQRFLKVISDSVKDDNFPLRFLIVGRPEVHIEHIIRRLPNPILTIDLAKLDDANRDIEKYLVDEFSRIASEQGLDLAWPGQSVIDDIVYKSSGNFIFASVVIRFIGDPCFFAKTQLEIILNMKPPKTMSPFAILDQLFLEILRRVPDQDFLKRYLAILTARISVSGIYGDLYKDDAVLMHVSEEELHANLRRMRSLLRFEARIDVYQRSFLDFLHDSSRSMEYCVDLPGGIRRYLWLFVDSLVRYVVISMEQTDRHSGPHFAPSFRSMIKDFPPTIELPVNEWPEVIQPLLDLQDKLLQLPDFASTWRILRCDKCTAFYLLRELLHLGLHLRRYKGQSNNTPVQSAMDVRKRRGVISSATTKRKTMNRKDPDSVLLSLFTHLPEMIDDWSPDKHVITLMDATLDFHSAEIAMRIRFISDAQKLVDLLVYLIDEKSALGNMTVPDAPRKATRLALEIFARVPILPLSLNEDNRPNPNLQRYVGIRIQLQILSQTMIASRVLDRRYIVPIWVLEDGKNNFIFVNGDADGKDLSMKQWRQRFKTPSSDIAIQVMLGLAKAIQYFHLMDVVLHRGLGSDDVFLDLGLRPRICCLYSTSRFLLDEECKEMFSREDNTFSFGCLLYELFSEVDTKPSLSTRERRAIITKRPSVLPEYAWQLIEGCCAEHPKTRPTINEVVDEMASWHIM